MRPMQELAYQKRGEQYLLIKSPPASGKSRALMFIALDKLENQGLKQAIVVVPERSIGGSFNNEPLSKFGFFADWKVEPKWNLCDAPGTDNGGKAESVKKFLESGAKALVHTYATSRKNSPSSAFPKPAASACAPPTCARRSTRRSSAGPASSAYSPANPRCCAL